MKNLKILSLIVIASMLLTVMPALAQPTMSLQLSAYSGYVGDTVTATGTIVTYNGAYEIYFDANKNGILETNGTDPKIGEGVATGYSFSESVEIPDAYADADNVWVYDILAGLPQSTQVWYTVLTKFTLSVDPSSNYEGGAFTFTGTVTGGKMAWDGVLDLKLRIVRPDATTYEPGYISDVTYSTYGYYSNYGTLGPEDSNLVLWGTYTAYMDYASDSATWTSGVASTTFDVRLTTQLEYERTLGVYIKHYVPIDKTLTKYALIDPDGVENVITLPMSYANGSWTAEYLVLQTYKNSPLGIWTIKLWDEDSGSYYKTATFKVIPSKVYVTNYWITTDAPMRTESITWHFDLYYADGSTPINAIDLTGGFPYRIHINDTLVAELTSNLLTDNVDSGCWEVTWKVPKDQAVSGDYHFVITPNAINDYWGNMGPSSSASSDYFEVLYAELEISDVQLLHPLPGASLQRTLTAKGLVLITYPDGSRYTDADYKWVNGTAWSEYDDVYSFSDAEYDTMVGLWILEWKVPYNAELAYYELGVDYEQVEDLWGNSNFNDDGWAPDEGHYFQVVAATITVTDFMTDSILYNTDDVVTVSFVASYPSGDPVTTTNNATLNPMVYIYTSDNTLYLTKVAGYSSATGKWSAKWIIGEEAFDGTWTAELKANAVVDDANEESAASNIGPTTAKTTTFDVTRISLTDVYKMLKELAHNFTLCCNETKTLIMELQSTSDEAVTQATNAATQAAAAKTAADAAKASADSASTKADAAITAANEAKTAASAAKTAADAAGSKADAAKAAADAAKTAGDAAKDASSNLTTLVYGAIGASLVAAIAAIVALMQISRKIA